MEQSNKLIAEFMGYPKVANDEDKKDYLRDCVKYHKSWDWLMPAVKKIVNEYCNTPFDDRFSRLTEGYENIWTFGQIEDTYNAVVEFIKDQNS